MNYVKQNHLPSLTEPLSGLSLWLKLSVVVLVSVLIKAHPMQPTWAIVMPLFAALVLVPIGVQLVQAENLVIEKWNSVFNYHLVVAILLAVSFVLDKGMIAGCLALPYFVWCSAVVLRGLKWDFSLSYLMTPRLVF